MRGDPGLRAELVARLERVRGQMSDSQFDELVRDVERVAQRFIEIEKAAWPRSDRESPPNG
jgi:hypothetical protein